MILLTRRFSREYEKRYEKELNLWDDLKAIERDISDSKSEMKDNNNYAEENMVEIRNLRAEAIELINKYYE